MQLRHVLVGSAIAASLNAAVFAVSPIIVVGSSNLLPNQAGQQLQLLISGSDQLVATDLYMELDPLAGGAPTITDLNLLTGTIFSTNNAGAKGTTFGTGTLSNFAAVGTTTNSGSVADSGLLVTLTIDTTGLSAGGVIHLNMSNTYNGVPSDFIASATGGPLTLVSPTYLSNLISIGTAPAREWNVNHGGTWGTDSNWTPFAPYANGDQANFLDAVTSGVANITLDGDRTAGSITFNDTAGSYLISQGIENGSIHLNGTLPAITNLAGNHTISAPVILSAATHIGLNGSAGILTMSGVISGNQNLSISGPGTLVLTAANSLGNATMSAGATVMLAGQGALGSGVTVDTTGSDFVFNRTDSFVTDTTFIGSGSLAQAGTGSTTLTGSNTYSGPTFINAGNLIIGNNGTTGTLGAGQITDNGALTFNRSNTLSVAAAISGTGSIVKQGGGKTTLSGAYTATGSIAVSGGGGGTLAFGNTSAPRQTAGVLLTASSVSVASSNTLDLGNHDLLIHSGSTAGLEAQVGAAYDFDLFDQAGISSSTAGVSGGLTTLGINSADDYNSFGTSPGVFDGSPVVSGDTLIKYTYAGDLNLDGVVDDNDLFQFLGTYLGTQVGDYAEGDLNYDGVVDDNDLFIFLANYLNPPTQTLGELDGSLADTIGASPAFSPALGGSSPVPEPASLAVLGLGAAALMRRQIRLKMQKRIS